MIKVTLPNKEFPLFFERGKKWKSGRKKSDGKIISKSEENKEIRK